MLDRVYLPRSDADIRRSVPSLVPAQKAGKLVDVFKQDGLCSQEPTVRAPLKMGDLIRKMVR